jgi:effector-binding domain-containing protein
MFKKILYLIVITCFIFIGVGMFLPRTVHVERSIGIDRPPSTVFALLNEFSTYSEWSPWLARDPNTLYRYSGPASGKGARMNWAGDPRLVGSGWQEITESAPWSLVRMEMEFDQMGSASSYFQLDPIGQGVHLTWGFDMDLAEGQEFFSGLMMGYFGLFFDGWIGTDYEQGLDRLKAFAESLPSADFSDIDVAIVDVEPVDILYVAMGSRESAGGIAAGLAAAYREITTLMTEQSIPMLSQPMAITRAWDAEDYEFSAAIPVPPAAVTLSGRVHAGKSPAGQAVRVVHRGPYDRMPASYEKLAAYMAVHGLKEGRVSWEQYISDPAKTPAEEAVTHIFFLVDDKPPDQD